MEHILGMYTAKCEYKNSDVSSHAQFCFCFGYLNKCHFFLQGLRLELAMTWGDKHYMGLTGLEVVGKDGESLPLDLGMMVASPSDLNDLPEYRNDLRTLDKYVSSMHSRKKSSYLIENIRIRSDY